MKTTGRVVWLAAVLVMALGPARATAEEKPGGAEIKSVVAGRMVCSEKCKQMLDLANGIKKCPDCDGICNVAHKHCPKCARRLGVCEVCGKAMGAGEKPVEVGEAELKSLTASNNAFACDLYGRVRAEGGNLFLSPYSISTALAMTYAGAEGETEKQMATALRFDLPEAKVHAAFQRLGGVLKSEGASGPQPYELHVANAVWTQQGYPVLGPFMEVVTERYGGKVCQANFERSAEDARQTINGWVEKETREKIKELVPKGVLSPETRLVLTNAIYFKGAWKSVFKKADTRDSPFGRALSEEQQKTARLGRNPVVPLMHQKGHFRYMENESMQALELPYRGGDLAMLILLPKGPVAEPAGVYRLEDLSAMEQSVTPANLDKWVAAMRFQEVMAYLPRFTMTKELSLAKTLSAMGMGDAFVSGKANFSGMSTAEELLIGAVLHKAFVEVNEEGTEAAAATVVAVPSNGDGTPPAVFKADHPFVFLIRHTRTGAILFMGRVMDPVGEGASGDAGAAVKDAGQAPQERALEFSSGGAHHFEGFGAWQVRLTPDGNMSVRHQVREKVTDQGTFLLAKEDNDLAWKLVSAADISGLADSRRAGVPDEVRMTFGLTTKTWSRSASIWAKDVRENKDLAALTECLAKLIEKHVGKKPVF